MTDQTDPVILAFPTAGASRRSVTGERVLVNGLTQLVIRTCGTRIELLIGDGEATCEQTNGRQPHVIVHGPLLVSVHESDSLFHVVVEPHLPVQVQTAC
jgi:hypothetical protein